MTSIPILPDNAHIMGNFLCRQELPSNYMADFSLMGFVVESVDAALTLLEKEGFKLHRHDPTAEVAISSYSDIVTIRNLLLAQGITCSYRDIAETIYQA